MTINGEKLEKGVVVLRLERQLLDLRSCPVKKRIDRLVYEGYLNILLNLEHIKKMDSSDIKRLIRANLSVRQGGGQIHICAVEPEIQKLLEMTRLDTVFDMYETEKEALLSLSGPENPFGSSLPTLS